MNEIQHNHGSPDSDSVHHKHRPYWRGVHRDWRVWVGLFFMLTAMIIYLMTNDLAGWHGNRPRQPLLNAVGQ